MRPGVYIFGPVVAGCVPPIPGVPGSRNVVRRDRAGLRGENYENMADVSALSIKDCKKNKNFLPDIFTARFSRDAENAEP